MSQLINLIKSTNHTVKNQSLDEFCRGASIEELLAEAKELEQFRKEESNLYNRVRALFFLYAIHRFYIPLDATIGTEGIIPYEAYEHMLNRRFEEAIDLFLKVLESNGANEGISSGLADAYHLLAFQTLADQVRLSVRSTAGNKWMFRTGHPFDQPLKIQDSLLQKDSVSGLFPCLHEKTPVRMDLSHSGWSDIFFLGMDYPEGAKVLNISVDLCIHNSSSEAKPLPPIETWFRIIDEPVLKLTSIDLATSSSITNVSEVFDFAKDYLGLLKAAVIASGIVPPGMEGIDLPLSLLLEIMVGKGKGIELVSKVNNIPKGSRLAVSTNLLASLISLCMRATGQTEQLTGILNEEERRLVASKAILGEWIGGSGGGWQDSGGVWPGMKLIEGVAAEEGDPEFGISKGRLLPTHTILDSDKVDIITRQKLQESLVMVHGGMAQNVGPILEMVTEKYLLRSKKEWIARQNAIAYFRELVQNLINGDIKAIGAFTQKNFDGPIQEIIPWATNLYTETLIAQIKAEFKNDFWGFWMMGGMSGGGMGFIFDPSIKNKAQERLLQIMTQTKKTFEHAIPFAMEPVVYDFKINEKGTYASLNEGRSALMPESYYTLILPQILKKDIQSLTDCQRNELSILGNAWKSDVKYSNFVANLFERMIPHDQDTIKHQKPLNLLLAELGFNGEEHEQIKKDLKSGRIGLSKNRLPVNTTIVDVQKSEFGHHSVLKDQTLTDIGLTAIQNGELAIVTLAGGVGSRWTKGAGVVKSLNPYAKFAGKHRNFLETHCAKRRKIELFCGQKIQHVFTTSYLTHPALFSFIKDNRKDKKEEDIYLSEGKVVGLRLYPTERDLRFMWEEMPQQLLDEQAQKVQQSLRMALINWTKTAGEAEDYRDNLPSQCIHPVGHWYEIPNMFLNGTLKQLIQDNPKLKHLLLHNIDTLGANADTALLGYHIQQNKTMTVEVITRKLDDRGGGLAKINGNIRLVEGMALPDEKIEFGLSYYNTNTFWINIDQLLTVFGLTRDDLNNLNIVKQAVYKMASRMPTYVTIREVKKRWGKGQEDIYPVTQFEKLWGDMTAIPEVKCAYINVPRMRGQQLKEVSQLDGWSRDGSKEFIEGICNWDE
ncbi:MAG TPA: UTP--glucose-1-phosphate uridylyltransferase [Prolixibacteraceae bacterium]|nr:UTP--glucose-1-phosphate uridylyltransferase [Prolixibacteraceae bacterium]